MYSSDAPTCYHLEIITETSEKAVIQLSMNNPNDEEALNFLTHFRKVTAIDIKPL